MHVYKNISIKQNWKAANLLQPFIVNKTENIITYSIRRFFQNNKSKYTYIHIFVWMNIGLRIYICCS